MTKAKRGRRERFPNASNGKVDHVEQAVDVMVGMCVGVVAARATERVLARRQ